MLHQVLRSKPFSLSPAESGSSLIQVIILAGLIGGMGIFFASRSLVYRENQVRMATKTEVLNDRRIIKYELVNRPFPQP